MSGQIPISSNHAAQIHNQALEIAAAHLERTAADYDQMYDQTQRAIGPAGGHHSAQRLGVMRDIAKMNSYVEKARLLRGQAAHLRELKLKEQ